MEDKKSKNVRNKTYIKTVINTQLKKINCAINGIKEINRLTTLQLSYFPSHSTMYNAILTTIKH